MRNAGFTRGKAHRNGWKEDNSGWVRGLRGDARRRVGRLTEPTVEWWDSRRRVRRLGEATVECLDGSDAIYETLALVHQAQAALSCVAFFMNFVMRVRRHVRAVAPVLF